MSYRRRGDRPGAPHFEDHSGRCRQRLAKFHLVSLDRLGGAAFRSRERFGAFESAAVSYAVPGPASAVARASRCWRAAFGARSSSSDFADRAAGPADRRGLGVRVLLEAVTAERANHRIVALEPSATGSGAGAGCLRATVEAGTAIPAGACRSGAVPVGRRVRCGRLRASGGRSSRPFHRTRRAPALQRGRAADRFAADTASQPSSPRAGARSTAGPRLAAGANRCALREAIAPARVARAAPAGGLVKRVRA